MCATSTDWLSSPAIAASKSYGWRKLDWGLAWPRQRIIASVFRLMAFSAAIFQIVAFPKGPVPYNAFPDAFISGSRVYPSGMGYNASDLVGLVVAAGVYSVLKIMQPFSWQRSRAVSVLLLSVDILAAALMVHFTGGIHSPFVLYTLVPVLSAALLRDYTVTIAVSLITSAYVLTGNIYNSASMYMPTLQAVNDFFVYVIALGLVAALPYAINLPLGRRVASDATMMERRRISHELHDSVCQVLCGLRWQVQRLSGRISADAALSGELKSIEEGVIAAEKDARGLLLVLRTLGDNGRFIPNMRHYLEQMRHYAGISHQLDCEDADIRLSEPIERELSMICIEALTNVKKHARAANVLFGVKAVDGRIRIKIVDDGCGFDASGVSAHSGHGLSIMRERAESVGGTLRVTSVIGKGTEINVDFPRGG